MNSSNLECENWKNDHIFLAEDVHYYNIKFAFVQIETLDDLNISVECQPSEYYIKLLKIFARKNILINNDLNLRGVINILNRTNTQVDVLFQNVNGFNQNGQLQRDTKQNLNTIRSFQMKNLIFDFYHQGKLLSSQNCSSQNFNFETNFFGEIKVLLLLSNKQSQVFYNSKICPYVFMNTKLQELFLNDISNSLIFKNRVEFLNIKETKAFDMNTKSLNRLTLNFYCDGITLTNLNPFVFKNLKYFFIKGNLEFIDKNLFENFNEIRYISIKSDALINFFHSGTKWINFLNRDLNVSLHDQLKFRRNINRLISVEFDVQSWFYFNKYYTFPNEDICLFKDFPHSQLVLPLIVFNPSLIEAGKECSCTMIWLVQNYKYYFYNDFKSFNQYVNLQPAFKDYFENGTINSCIRTEKYLKERFVLCNFSRLFENCDFTSSKNVAFSRTENFILLLKWFQYIIEVYIRTILCLFGLITNLFTLKVIHNKRHSRHFQNSMYNHISINAFFNILFCLIYLFSLMNICIFPKNSFCSSIWRTEFSQYFHIYVILFLGNALRLCCNISYIFFSISRCALSGTSNENRFRIFIEKQNIKRFYIILFIVTLGFSLFLLFENNVNKLYEKLDDSFIANSYDVRYCENYNIPAVYERFILAPNFYFRCQVFRWLNIVNNILNNVLFLFISIFIDIFMIRYSNKIIEEKKALNCPHLERAIHFKKMLNKMIITNGTLYFLAHIPEFVVTLIVSFCKSADFIVLCVTAFDCNHLIEMAQMFHFISIAFQFFIFLIFDHNFQNSLADLIGFCFKKNEMTDSLNSNPNSN